MQAIILAAGMGRRLKDLTENNTKCMVKVNGVTLIDRMLHQIESHDFSKIIIVIGYEGQKLVDYIKTLNISTPIEYINNPIYDKTNNIYSLSLAKHHLIEDDTLLFESDLIFEDSIIDLLLSDQRKTLALVDKYESWMDGTCVKLNEDNTISSFIPGKNFNYDEINEYYKTVNIYKFGKNFSQTHYVPFLEAYQEALGVNEYYEQVLRVITMLDNPVIQAIKLSGQLWYEIDDIQDLDIAESMFITNEEQRINMLQGRYGGYWRYPRLLDFCYLVNPYYPSKKLINEIKASFNILLTQYPSGIRVNSLLASKNFNIPQSNIVVGNGAAELIKSLMFIFNGKLGIVCPTFEEYSNRYTQEKIVRFCPSNKNFSYTVDELIKYFSTNTVNNLIIINPDNPSGNYINKSELIRLINWSSSNNVNLVIDESFADFSDEINNSLICKELILNNNNLFVIKSISKSYGIPGLRLGILASGNTNIINQIKQDVSIWNINSFAEFYMQIAEKYNNDYSLALDKFRQERSRFEKDLKEIKGLRIIPTQANFFMAEITTNMTATELTRKLIVNHNILIKNLFSKVNIDNKQYIRIAIKTEEENKKLIEALSQILN